MLGSRPALALLVALSMLALAPVPFVAHSSDTACEHGCPDGACRCEAVRARSHCDKQARDSCALRAPDRDGAPADRSASDSVRIRHGVFASASAEVSLPELKGVSTNWRPFISYDGPDIPEPPPRVRLA